MTDYGHELLFGTFITPANAHPEAVVGLAQLSEELGLDLVTFQDHPYQPAFLDTWTLMSYVAASTASIHIAPNVLNLPLRPPAVVARAAASLDLLSGGRFELGLGAGAFGAAIAAMGGPQRTPGEAVEALAEAVTILRELWDTSVRGGVRIAGHHYTVNGAKRGPAPVHPIGIWLGAYQPRMLRLIGRVADGWLPSAGYLPPDRLADANAIIDGAAAAAGRSPADIRRLYNISGSFGHGGDFLQGPPDQWVEQLTGLAVGDGISTFILGTDDPDLTARFAEEVAPAVREMVAAERAGAGEHGVATNPQAANHDGDRPQLAASAAPVRAPVDSGGSFPIAFTPDPRTRLSPEPRWAEDERPGGPDLEPGRTYTAHELASSRQLVAVHDHLRAELEQVRDLIGQVLDGSVPPGDARSRISEMTMRQNSWTVGAYCAAYCRVVTTHHSIEDQALFPRLRRADPRLAPVVERLHYEHEIIHEVLEEMDRALVGFVGADGDGRGLRAAVDALSDTLLSHLSYEERELLEPIARLGLLV